MSKKGDKAKEGNAMAVMVVPVERMDIIKAEDFPAFVEEFNKNIPSKEFFELCEKAGKLFGKKDK